MEGKGRRGGGGGGGGGEGGEVNMRTKQEYKKYLYV